MATEPPEPSAGEDTRVDERERIVGVLSEAGCVAPAAEADELLRAKSRGVGPIDELIARRIRGEPLAWITGSVLFCDVLVRVEPGVFVPRPQTEQLARRAVDLLPEAGIAVDLCTGSGAVALVLQSARPRATVLATDVDPVAVACAQRNGIQTLVGSLAGPLPPSFRRRVDVMTAVVPYVPSEELHLLPRDVLAYEPRRALDGGPGGTALLRLAVEAAAGWLRPGGSLLLELGGDQAAALATTLAGFGFAQTRVRRDDDGHVRSVEAAFRPEMRVEGDPGR